MLCNEQVNGQTCKGQMISGKGLAPVYGNFKGNLSRGATIYPIGGTLVDCLKCERCGHSISPYGQLVTSTPGYVPQRSGT